MAGLDPITAGLNFANGIVERIWPNAADREAAKVKLAELAANGELERLRITSGLAQAQIEATKSDSWNMKARALLLFGGAGGIVYQLIVHPLLVAVLLGFNPMFPVERIPALDLKTIMGLVGGMLGLT